MSDHRTLAVVNPETTCALCRTTFASAFSLEQHMISRHANPQEIAPLRFSASDSHNIDNTITRCILCMKDFKSSDALRQHFAQKHPGQVPEKTKKVYASATMVDKAPQDAWQDEVLLQKAIFDDPPPQKPASSTFVEKSREDTMNAIYQQKKASVEEVHNPNKYHSKTVVSFDEDDDILFHHTRGQTLLTNITKVNSNNESEFPPLGSMKISGEKEKPKQAAPKATSVWGTGPVEPPPFQKVQAPAFSAQPKAQPQPPVVQAPPPRVAAPPYVGNPVSPMPAPVHQYQVNPNPSGSFAPSMPQSFERPRRPRPTLQQVVWQIGDVCEGRWSEDGQWYKARIEDMSNDGQYFVTYMEWGNQEILRGDSLRPLGYFG